MNRIPMDERGSSKVMPASYASWILLLSQLHTSLRHWCNHVCSDQVTSPAKKEKKKRTSPGMHISLSCCKVSCACIVPCIKKAMGWAILLLIRLYHFIKNQPRGTDINVLELWSIRWSMAYAHAYSWGDVKRGGVCYRMIRGLYRQVRRACGRQSP